MEEQKEASEIDYVKWLSELTKKDIPYVGGKGANLAEMFNAKLPIPPAFVITAQAYKKFVEAIQPEIDKILASTDVDNTKELNQNTRKIRDIIEEQSFPKEMESEIRESYETLGTSKADLKENALDLLDAKKRAPLVAVRSSATTEDLASASFAGQQETFLNIKGVSALLDSIKKCFSSLYTARATYYRTKRGFEHSKALLAVVVQKMINSEKSGVMFSKNPITDEENVVIEAVYGLGEGIVSGKIHPDQYIVNRKIEILDKKIAEKKISLIRGKTERVETVKLTEEKSKSQVLTKGEIERLADYAISVEKHYKKPQDMEFAIENKQIYIVQSRPITTSAKEKGRELQGKVILKGLPASPGVASGTVKIIHKIEDLEKVQKGDVLVTEMTNPDMVITMQKSDAIITDEGGATSHAAIVSREMGIPCIVGTKNATTHLKEGAVVTVDGARGLVYEGEVGEEKKKEILPVVETKTKIKVIVDLPSFAARGAKAKTDEVGLLRLEGIIAESGKHPMMFLAEKRTEAYVKLLEKGISEIASHFKKVWIRASDIRTDEYRNLQGSPKEQEVNPMLGFHGIRFSLKRPELLEAELQAIKNVAEKFQDKEIGLMFPQVISIQEVQEVKKAFEKFKQPNMKFGVMVETPAACQIIEELCDQGIEFISFGTNDLTQYTLAVDRGNENIQDLYNEMHPAILSQMKHVIKVCTEKGIETSICGQAGSKKEMAEFLVKCGIKSISVNPDAAYEISKFVQQLEQNLPEPEQEKEPEPEEKTEEKPEQEPTPEPEPEQPTPTPEEKPAEDAPAEEFPDVDIGVDIFSQQTPSEPKKESTVSEQKQQKPPTPAAPELLADFPFIPEPLKQTPEDTREPGREPEPESSEVEDREPEDAEINEIIEEMHGNKDKEDIDIPQSQEEPDILDIF